MLALRILSLVGNTLTPLSFQFAMVRFLYGKREGPFQYSFCQQENQLDHKQLGNIFLYWVLKRFIFMIHFKSFWIGASSRVTVARESQVQGLGDKEVRAGSTECQKGGCLPI